MRILFYRYNSICEADIINVFEENAFEVDSITEEMENKELEAVECLKMVSEALKKKEYSMVFSINFFPIVSEVCNIKCHMYVGLWIAR